MARDDTSERLVAQAALVTTDDALAAVVDTLRARDRFGIDTEFHRERSYFPHLALVQLAWEDGIAVVDPLSVDMAPLASVLDGDGLAILHAPDQDLEVLERTCGAIPRRLFDTQVAAGFLGFPSASLATLVERLLGRKLAKGDQLTDWTRRPLTAAQLRYAANDVAHLLDLEAAIRAALRGRGRLAWAEAECEVARTRSHAPTVPEEAWWRLRQARQLRGAARGVAQEVCAWRERAAQDADQPVRFFVPDLAVASIAQRPPRTRAELERVRSIDGRHLANGGAEAILAAVARGERLGAGELRLPARPNGDAIAKPAVALAAAWAAERARRLEIDPAIFATRNDVVGFLRDPPEGRLATGWRHELAGDPIRRLVAGDAAIALDDGALVLERRSRAPLDGAP